MDTERLGGVGKLKGGGKFNDLIGARTSDFQASSIALQPSTLPRPPPPKILFHTRFRYQCGRARSNQVVNQYEYINNRSDAGASLSLLSYIW
jgi:hypothetical protein